MKLDLLTRLAFLLASMFPVLLASQPASACTGALTCRKVDALSPSDGASDVPRNVELRVGYLQVAYSQDDPPSPLRLESAAGVEVVSTWQRVLVAPTIHRVDNANYETWVGTLAQPLEPNTTYHLQHAFEACDVDAGRQMNCGLCPSTRAATIATFTTGVDVRTVPPAAPVIGAPTYGLRTVATGSGLCGPYDQCPVDLSVGPLPTGQVLRVIADDGKHVGDFSPAGVLTISVHRAGSNGYPAPPANFVQFGAARYRFYAADITGTLSAPVDVTIDACAADADADADAGADADADAGAGSVAPDARATSFTDSGSLSRPDGSSANDTVHAGNSGCSAGGPRANAPWLGLLLGAGLLLHRRRRRL